MGLELNHEIDSNPEALARFKSSSFTSDEYYTCAVMLTESAKIVDRHLERWDNDYPSHAPTSEDVKRRIPEDDRNVEQAALD